MLVKKGWKEWTRKNNAENPVLGKILSSGEIMQNKDVGKEVGGRTKKE